MHHRSLGGDRLQSSENQLWWSSQRVKPWRTLRSRTVNHITFQSVQTLHFTAADEPSVTLHQGTWTLVANRNGEQIMITAPDTRRQMALSQPAPAKRRIKHKSQRVNWTPKGEDHPKAKLSETDVLEMRELFNDKSYRKDFGSDHQILMDFAKIYNIHYSTAYKIVHGQSWKHLNNV
jgi:hypothetical protein